MKIERGGYSARRALRTCLFRKVASFTVIAVDVEELLGVRLLDSREVENELGGYTAVSRG